MANGIITAGLGQRPAATDIDLLQTTLDNLEDGSFTETFQLQRYPISEALFQGDRGTADGGATGHQKRIRLGLEENARGTRLWATGQLNVRDMMGTMYWPWVMFETGMAFEMGEVARNRGKSAIIDLVRGRRAAMWEDVANYFERRGMVGPDSAGDDLTPQGLLFHARMLADDATDSVGGFNGVWGPYEDGTASSMVANLDATLTRNNRLRNWAFTHDGQVNATFLRQLRTAIHRVGWRPPKMAKGLVNPREQTYSHLRVFWNQTMAEQYEEFVNNGPDDRDGNASPFWGDLPYGPVETVSTPVLDGIANSPVIGIDLSVTKVVVMRGRWMVEDEPLRDPTNHRIVNVWYDSDYAIVCYDPRRNFCGHVAW